MAEGVALFPVGTRLPGPVQRKPEGGGRSPLPPVLPASYPTAFPGRKVAGFSSQKGGVAGQTTSHSTTYPSFVEDAPFSSVQNPKRLIST